MAEPELPAPLEHYLLVLADAMTRLPHDPSSVQMNMAASRLVLDGLAHYMKVSNLEIRKIE